MSFAVLAGLLACEPDPIDSAVADDSSVSDPCAVADPDANAFEIEGLPECGEPLYRTHCESCHGPSGEGTSAGPPMTEMMPMHPDEQILFVVIAGSGDMPGFELEQAELAHLLAYLRESFGEYDPSR